MWKYVSVVLFFPYKQVEKRGTQAWKSTPLSLCAPEWC